MYADQSMNFHRLYRTPSWLFAVFIGSALSCCSCTTVKSMARTEDFSEEIQRAKSERATRLASAHGSVPPEMNSAGVVRLGGNKSASPIQQVAFQEPYCPPNGLNGCPPGAACPPEPRMPVAGPNPYGVGMPCVEMAELPNPESYADEYLCDGGDRDWPVHYNATQRFGLDTEDTVAEYVDHTGKERMKPSNKVCVYAPRFASVRTVSQPVLGESLHTSVGMINTTGDSELRTKLPPTTKVKRDAAGGLRMRSRASGADSDLAGAGLTQDLAAVEHDKINNLFQNIDVMALAKVDQPTAAWLNYGLGAAQTWSMDNTPVITAQVEQPLEGLFEISAHTLTVIDDQEEPGELLIVKLADKKEAQPGDVITFTIRYQNTGDREVHYVRIVDNLTPRLEYVDDSATCDREGRLAVEDNGEGSLVLTWELSDPLPGKTGGVITFQAKVR